MILKNLTKTSFISVFIISLLYYGCGNDMMPKNVAPDFVLKDLSGKKVSLKQFNDKVVILDFWATWCPPCRYSIPELVDIQERYKHKDLVILGISVDDPQHVNNNYLKAFKSKYNINYMILRSNNRLLMNYFGTTNIGLPTMFIIDRKGKIMNKFEGFLPGAVEKSLKKIIL